MEVSSQPPGGWNRPPLSRRDFDAACARLEEIYQNAGISCTSGVRSNSRNQSLRASGSSHVKGLGRDYVFDVKMMAVDKALAYVICKALGFRAEFHDAGTGDHLHVQSSL